MGGSVGGFLGGVGSGLSAANPFHKLDTTQVSAPAAPIYVNAPTGMPKSAPQASYNGQATAATMVDIGAAMPAQQAATGDVNGALLQGVGSANAFRQAQLNAINGLNGVASGQDNPAQALVNQNMAQNTAQQFAMANSARPGGGNLALRNAMTNASQNNTQAAVQGAQLSLNNRMNATQLQGQIAGQGYGQDINVAGQNASNMQQANLANQSTRLATNQMNAQNQQQAYMASYQARLAQAQMDAQNAQQANMTTYQGDLSTNQLNAQLQGNYDQLGAQYAQMGQQAQAYNQNAWTGYQGQLMGQQQYNNNTNIAAQKYQREQIGNFMSGAGGMLGTASSMGLFGSGGMGPNGSTGMGSNSFSGGTNPNFMGPPAG